jgi:hypothetical protein
LNAIAELEELRKSGILTFELFMIYNLWIIRIAVKAVKRTVIKVSIQREIVIRWETII